MTARSRSLLLACAVFALVAVGIALVLQHVFGMRPCAWCTLQRLVYLGVAAFALLGWGLGARVAVLRGFALLVALASFGGLAAALQQQFVAAKTASCAFTFADRVLMQSRLDEMVPWLFFADASCSEANVPLLGVPFAVWSATAFVLLAIGALAAAWRAGSLSRAPQAPVAEVSR